MKPRRIPVFIPSHYLGRYLACAPTTHHASCAPPKPKQEALLVSPYSSRRQATSSDLYPLPIPTACRHWPASQPEPGVIMKSQDIAYCEAAQPRFCEILVVIDLVALAASFPASPWQQCSKRSKGKIKRKREKDRKREREKT
jgi:hypothetical protein